MKKPVRILQGAGRYFGAFAFAVALGSGCVGGEPTDAGNEPEAQDSGSPETPTPDAGTPEDAGTPPNDAGTPEDAGTPPTDAGTPEDAGTPPTDAGTPDDAGTPPTDGGTPPTDGGTPPTDGGTPPADGGTPPADGGTPPTDGGTPPTDGGTPPTDGGTPPTDGGTPPTDGGTPPTDGGTPPTDGGAPGNAPVLIEAQVVVRDDGQGGSIAVMSVVGTDADSNVSAVRVAARDPQGVELLATQDFDFDPTLLDVTGTAFTAAAGLNVTGIVIGEVDIQVVDATGLASNLIVATVNQGNPVDSACIENVFGVWASCDNALACDNITNYVGTCTVPPGAAPVVTSATFVETVEDDAECIAEDPLFPIAFRYQVVGTADIEVAFSTFVSDLTGPDPAGIPVTGNVGPGAFDVVALLCANELPAFDDLVADVGVADTFTRLSNTLPITFPDFVPDAPPEWTCNVNFYAADDGCDCGCGVVDPDCADATIASCDYCTNTDSCGAVGGACDVNPYIDVNNNGVCSSLPDPVPSEWTCNTAYYGADDGCDCGCGVVDPDCDDATISSCTFCTNTGACSAAGGDCDVNLLVDPANNGICLP